MRIGFEAKRVYRNKTGLGNYGRDLLRMLTTLAPSHEYWAFTPTSSTSLFSWDTPNYRCISGKWGPSAEAWRLWGQTNHPDFQKLDVYHGLSGELPWGLKIPSVVTIHDLLFERYPAFYSPIDRWIHYQKFKSATERATRVVAISEQTKQDIHTYLKVPMDKIQVIYQGCHPIFQQRFSVEEKAAARKKWGLPDQFLIGVGTLEKRKNMEVVIRALRDLDIPLVLIGGRTKYTDYLEKLIRDFGMGHRVWLLHTVPLNELALLYQSAYALVYPSLFEGFGIPLLEGLYSGIPVLTGQGGCFPEAGGPGAYYLNQQDADQWRDQLEKVVSHRKDQEDRIAAGLQHVTRFAPTVWVPQWIELYQSLK